ncbi:hypothetical protein ORK51_15680 [Stenotrophomonas rhizophila]|uniref:hypothetical protein n=1 Tax=Stenotrophomonas rhizophila TaxID=216778 RepID=UPI00224A8D12|nr:hypothetical protein [Stenotrophomonas rhizophila]MCX2921618.1 hypothetical protein [Stenotrophomonas rhizophila]
MDSDVAGAMRAQGSSCALSCAAPSRDVMLMKSMFLALFMLFSVSHAHAADAPALPPAWTEIGVTVDMPYAQAKALLLKAGWVAEAPDNDGDPSFAAHPEVDCGQGWDAICSAGFSRKNEAYGLVLTPTDDGNLRVQGVF